MSSDTYTLTAENIIHENENYLVVLNDDGTGYGVMNQPHGVVEFEASSLPECIFAAENLNVVLVYKTYEWIGKRAAEKVAEEAKLAAGAAGLTLIN